VPDQKRPCVSLCTYTFNDGHLLDGLLEQVRAWTQKPDEILVVDDGSTRPYRLPRTSVPARLIRLDQNRGNTFTRTLAVNKSRGTVVVCADCDIRPDPGWIEACLPHAMKKDVGLVSGPLFHRSGNDPVSVYLARFGENFNFTTGQTEFIPGGIWMIRREIWDIVGGFGDYDRPTRQDQVLCRRLKDRGYRLFCDERAKAYQVRKLSRRAFVRKFWARFDTEIKQALYRLPSEHAFPEFFRDSLLVFMLKRTARIIQTEAPLPAYLELLYMLHMVLDLIRFGQDKGLFTHRLADSFAAASKNFFGEYAALWRFLKLDLAKLGHELPSADHSPGAPDWDPVFSGLGLLEQDGLLAWLDARGVPLLLENDRRERTDFSFYDRGPATCRLANSS